MLKITKLTDYGVMIMSHFARWPDETRSAGEIAQQLGIADPTVGKVLKILTRGGLLVSQRGVKGGYRLPRPPQEISLLEIMDAMEGEVALTECSAREGVCTLERSCSIRGSWVDINRQVRGVLSGISLLQMNGVAGMR